MADNGQIDNVYVDFEVKDNGADDKISKFDEALEKLIATLERIDDKLTGFKDNFKGIESAIGNINIPTEKLEQSASGVEKATKKIEDGAKKIKSIEKGDTASTAFDGIEQSAKKAAVSIDYLLSDSAKLEYLQKSLAEAKTKLGELAQGGAGYENKDVRSLINQIHRLQKEIDKSSVNLMDFATKPTAPMSRWQRILNSISSVLSKIGSIGSKAFEKIGKSTKKANNSSRGYQKGLRGLLGTAKRFLIFGTFFTIQRQVSQAFSEGTQNLYQYSKAIDGTFAKSMDRIATSFLYLKNAIGAAVAPIINAVTPALESLIDTVAEFGNKLAETFAALSGATTFKKAIKSHKEYAEAVNNTNNALAKFDEINNITTSKSKEKQDFGSMFVETQVSTPDWANDIAKGIKNRDWNSVGSILSEKLNEQVQKLDDTNIGKKIGSKLNQALDFANGFIKTFDFGKFTTTLLNEITDFIEEIDWTNVGELFGNLLKGALNIIESIAEWIANWDTTKIGDALVDFVKGIEWKEVGKAFWNALLAALKATSNILFGKSTVGTALSSTLDFFKIDDRSFKERATELFSKVFSSFLKNDLPQMQKNPFAYFLGLFRKIQGFADGGYPASGEIFISRENGIPEMVGSIGGRTAVANNDQIVEAVSVGVYNAVVDAMSRSGGNKQPTIVQINGREVFRAVQDESTAYSRRTGQPAF